MGPGWEIGNQKYLTGQRTSNLFFRCKHRLQAAPWISQWKLLLWLVETLPFLTKKNCTLAVSRVGINERGEGEGNLYGSSDSGFHLPPCWRARQAHTSPSDSLHSDHVFWNCGSPKFSLIPAVVCLPLFFSLWIQGISIICFTPPSPPPPFQSSLGREWIHQHLPLTHRGWGELLILGWKDC